ncbi:hypothetical protein DEO72_LG8g2582 [Vigna unguiculata]|uniref:Uncharacterized protein n=1 Tax=Vigna unguiculata TaxID=3917 RepID=A0A4D6MSV1_VIGUN|nr:hypothetical protein DEO72_LG8g2582 [Vigna unguiculata]
MLMVTASVPDWLRFWAMEKWLATKPCSTLSSESLEMFNVLLVPNQCGEGRHDLRVGGLQFECDVATKFYGTTRSGNYDVRRVGNCVVISCDEEGGNGEEWETTRCEEWKTARCEEYGNETVRGWG